MSKQKTHEEFLSEFYAKNPKSENIKILSRYNGINNSIDCLCMIDNYKWASTPNRLIHRKHGCPMCAGNAKRTTEEITSILDERGFDLLSEYYNIHTKIKVRCRACFYEWETEPNVIINKECGCPKCIGIAKKTTDEFINELSEINPYVLITSEYNGANEWIGATCKICNHSWTPTPWNLLDGHGCPKCNVSNGEDKCENYFKNNNVEYISQKKFSDLFGISGFRHLSYDFYLPDYNLLIEYQGQQHEKPVSFFNKASEEEAIIAFGKQQEHDRRKRDYAKKNNIELLEIWYWDFDNIEDILDKKLIINSNGKST